VHDYLQVIIAVLILALAGIALHFWLRKKAAPLALPPAIEPELPRLPGPTRHPIVLVHGFAGFDSIRFGKARHDYFRGIRARLESLGHRVEVVRLPPIAGVKNRAERLAEQVRALGAERVNLIAHSMGGLDARYAITKLGLREHVASLTTLGTPHRGTPIVNGAKPIARWLARLGAEGIWDISPARMEEFNRDVPDAAGVEYFSYVSAVERGASPLLWPAVLLIREPNDGLVPAESQSWGNVAGHLAVDHWGQIGWSRSFDAAALYEKIATELSARGL
jgi:triacylglycerol lipase